MFVACVMVLQKLLLRVREAVYKKKTAHNFYESVLNEVNKKHGVDRFWSFPFSSPKATNCLIVSKVQNTPRHSIQESSGARKQFAPFWNCNFELLSNRNMLYEVPRAAKAQQKSESLRMILPNCCCCADGMDTTIREFVTISLMNWNRMIYYDPSQASENFSSFWNCTFKDYTSQS